MYFFFSPKHGIQVDCVTFYTHFLACVELHKDKVEHPDVAEVRLGAGAGVGVGGGAGGLQLCANFLLHILCWCNASSAGRH